MAGLMETLGLNSISTGITTSGMMTMAMYSIWIIIFFVIVGFGVGYMNYKKTYRYPVRILKVRENGKVKEMNCLGGYINRGLKGAELFRIKPSFLKSIDLTETPKLKYLDEDDRVYYKQIDLNTFIQMKRTMTDNELKLEPVESDVRYGAILSVQKARDILKLEPTWKKILPYVSLLILAIVFIVSFYLLMDKCGM
jgi:hypothetical protein